MAAKTFDVPPIGTIRLYKRRSNRSIRLSVSHDGAVRVSLPYYVPYQAGISFAKRQTEWILSHHNFSVALLKADEKIGKAHRLSFVVNPNVQRPTVRLSQNLIIINLPKHLSWQGPLAQQAARRGALRALKQQAEQLLPQRLAALSARTGFRYRNITYKPLKSRWGSCSSQGDIALNIYLLQLPWELIDYVILHELTHTKIPRHGPVFWEEIKRHLPETNQYRRAIRAHQPVLGGTTFVP